MNPRTPETVMTKLSALALVLGIMSGAAFAYDSDPGYGARGESSSGGRANAKGPQYYYKPTMRYYGKDYVVTYRFVQWNEKMSKGAPSTFEGAQHGMSAAAMKAAAGQEPRVTYYRQGQQRTAPSTAVQPVRSSTTATTATAPATKAVPEISSSTSKKN